MGTPFLGEIRTFAFSFPPKGWAQCNGQILSIQQNTALFSLLGTQYGGDGKSNFALPDLRGRVAVEMGTSVNGTPYIIGQVAGSEGVALTAAQIPPHTHDWPVSTGAADTEKGGTPTEPISTGYSAFNAGPGDSTLAAGSTSGGGSGVPHPNMAPYLVVNFCIALQGIFPSRN